MASIKLNRVSVEIPIYSNNNRSIKNSFIKKFTGNKSTNTNSVIALNNITLDLKDGDRLGIMGSNGSGKSTLLRTIAGVYVPTSGTITVKGRIASLIDISLGIDHEATGMENIRMRSVMMGTSLKKIKSVETEIADFTGLGDAINLPVYTYSAGMQMRLGFAVSTALDAEIILMDEWLSVGDNEFLKKAESRLHDFIKRSSILVIASHSQDTIDNLSNKILQLIK
jgi:lipopolysaccharide transport system ATP-binding protein